MDPVTRVPRPHTRPRQLVRDIPRRILWSWLVLTLAVFGGAALYHRAMWGDGDPARALEAAIDVAGGNLALNRAGAVAWDRAVAKGRARLATVVAGGDLYTEWRDFLSPAVPPVVCVAPGEAAVPRGAAAPLAAAVRDLRRARAEGAPTRDAAAELREGADRFVAAHPAHDGSFFVGYNLGVASLETGQAQSAVRELARISEVFAPEFLPSRNRSDALAFARTNGIGQDEVVRTFLGRYLTGLAKLRRAEVTEDAIVDFRYAISTVNYMHPGLAMPRGNAEEIDVPLVRGWACDGTGLREELTSLDAYAGLVAAYLASLAYTNPEPGALERELARRPGELDALDPLREVILYGQQAARTPGTHALPENVLWAASNLQTLLRINRVGASRQLSAARTVLGLQILSTPEWVRALSAQQGFTPCRFLEREWADLEGLGRRYWAMDADDLSVADQVTAGLAVYVAAASAEHCPAPIEPTPEARSGLLRAGLPFLPDVLPGLYERRRFLVETARSADRSLEEMADAVEAEAAMFARGDAPAHIQERYDLDDADDFVGAWRAALFRDVAEALAAAGVSSRGRAPSGLAPEPYLRGLEEAVRLADVPPSEVYEWAQFQDLAARVGPGFARWMGWRYRVRSTPEMHWAILAGGAALALLLVTWGHLLWWRWRLIAGVQYPRQRRAWEEENRPEQGAPA